MTFHAQIRVGNKNWHLRFQLNVGCKCLDEPKKNIFEIKVTTAYSQRQKFSEIALSVHVFKKFWKNGTQVAEQSQNQEVGSYFASSHQQ